MLIFIGFWKVIIGLEFFRVVLLAVVVLLFVVVVVVLFVVVVVVVIVIIQFLHCYEIINGFMVI